MEISLSMELKCQGPDIEICEFIARLLAVTSFAQLTNIFLETQVQTNKNLIHKAYLGLTDGSIQSTVTARSLYNAIVFFFLQIEKMQFRAILDGVIMNSNTRTGNCAFSYIALRKIYGCPW